MESGGVSTTEAMESGALVGAQSLVAYLTELKERRPRRELSLALTHAEESLMWLERLAPTAQAEETAEAAPATAEETEAASGAAGGLSSAD